MALRAFSSAALLDPKGAWLRNVTRDATPANPMAAKPLQGEHVVKNTIASFALPDEKAIGTVYELGEPALLSAPNALDLAVLEFGDVEGMAIAPVDRRGTPLTETFPLFSSNEDGRVAGALLSEALAELFRAIDPK